MLDWGHEMHGILMHCLPNIYDDCKEVHCFTIVMRHHPTQVSSITTINVFACLLLASFHIVKEPHCTWRSLILIVFCSSYATITMPSPDLSSLFEFRVSELIMWFKLMNLLPWLF